MNQKKISKQFFKNECYEDTVLGPYGIHRSRWTSVSPPNTSLNQSFFMEQ